MKKFIVFFCLMLVFVPNVYGFTINSEALVAMDIDSGRIFYEKNADNKRLIASTTKIMTAILAIESNRLEEIVEVGEEVLKMYGSNIYIELHEHMILLDLVYGLLMRSGNDAATVIATFVGGTEERFVQMMNEKAKSLGMDDTIFSNPSGLDDETENYSTARDLATIYAYAYKNDTFRKIIGTKKYTTSTDFKGYSWQNKTKLVNSYDKCTGGKTGYTPRAGRVLVTSASNNDLDITIASFNHGNYDYNLHERIYEDVFNNYQNKVILDVKDFKLKNEKYENIYIKESFTYPLKNKEEEKISKKIKYNDSISSDNVVGVLYIYLDDEIIFKTNLYADPLKQSIFDKIKSFFINLLA